MFAKGAIIWFRTAPSGIISLSDTAPSSASVSCVPSPSTLTIFVYKYVVELGWSASPNIKALFCSNIKWYPLGATNLTKAPGFISCSVLPVNAPNWDLTPSAERKYPVDKFVSVVSLDQVTPKSCTRISGNWS